jgi:hypothetical protein
MTQPYHRLPAETAKAYEAFTVYRSLDTGERSLERVSETLHKSVTLLARWSRANDWVKRAAAYDDYLKEQDRIAFEKHRQQAKSDRLKILAGFKGIVAQSLKNLKVDDPRYADVVQGLRLLLEQERIELDDLPAQKIEHTGKDRGPIETKDVTLTDDERIAKLADILNRARERASRSDTESD